MKVKNCYPSSYHVKRHTVQQTTPPYFNPNRRLTKRKNAPDAYIHVYRNAGIRVNWTHGSCTACILNLQYAGYFETCNEMKFIKTNNTKLKLWWTHVTKISFWSLVMGLHRFFITASCLSELSWKSVKLCWVNGNRTAGSQYIDGSRCFTLFRVHAKRQEVITTNQGISTIKYILTWP